MIKKGTRYLLLPLLFISMCVCADALFFKPGKVVNIPSYKPAGILKNTKKSQKIKQVFAGSITVFSIPGELAPAVFTQTSPNNYIIGIVVHAGTDIANLIPHVEISPGSTIDPSPTDVLTDFNGGPLYTVDPAGPVTVHYNAQVFAAHTAATCPGVPAVLTGTFPTPSGTLAWEMLNTTTSTWAPAPNPNSTDYTTQPLPNATTAPVVYTFRRSITTMVGTAYDSYYDLTVNPSTAISGNTINQPSTANSTFCVSGDPGTITGNPPSGGLGPGTYTYQWQSSTGSGFSNILNATGLDYAPGTVTTTTSYQRVVTSGNCTPPKTSTPVKITIQPGITNNHIFEPGTTFYCGQSISSIINGSNPPSGGAGSGTFQYQWQSCTDGINFTDIPGSGAQGNDYIFPVLTQTTYYRRMAKSGACSTFVPSDNTITITIEQGLSGNAIAVSGPTAFCGPGDPANITGNPVTGGNGTPSYQWESSPDGGSYQPISGAIGQNYDPPVIITTTYYHRTVTSGSCSTPSISTPVVFTVEPPLSANTISATGTTTFCAAGDPSQIDGVAITGGNGTPVYQWESSEDGTNFQPISGANGQNYDPKPIIATTYYHRTVTSGSCSTPSISGPVVFTVEPPLSANTISATGPTTFCATGDPSQIDGVAITGGNGTPAYQWESSEDGTNFQPINGANGQNYDPAPIIATTYYHRMVTSGSCSTPSISTPVIFTVTPVITANAIHTATEMFCATSGTFTITGDPPTGGDGSFTYQWQSSADNSSYLPIQGAISPSYDSPSLSAATTWFRRVVSSGACDGTSISTPVKITVYPALTGNSITAPPVAQFCQQGDAAPITGPAPTSGDGSPQYQWQQSPDNFAAHFTDITGQTGKDLDPPSLTATMFYRRVITELTCTTPLISNVIEIHITPPLVAGSNQIQPPLITNNCTSVDPATIIGNIPSGGDGFDSFRYQWESSTNNGATWTPVQSDGNAPDYDPPPITVSTMYHRNVTSGACAVPLTSNPVTLTIVDSPPNIAINNAAPICSGGTATLSVVSPDASLTYNWYDTPTRDNLLYQGPAFTTLALTANQTFYAEASNGTCSSPQLASVDVTVNPLPGVPVLTETAPTGCNGSSLILHVSNPQGNLTYKWYSAQTGGTPVFTGPDFTTPVLTADIIYYVDGTNASGCVSASRANAAITVYPLPVAVAKGAEICPGTVAILTANEPDPDEEIHWYTSATGGTSIFTGNSFTTPVLNSATTYYAEAVNTVSGCVSATRSPAKVQILGPLSPPPQVSVTASVAPEITFTWIRVLGATGYRVSIDGGASYTDPSSGSNGTSHTVTGLQVGQRVTIIVHTLGISSCQTSTDTNPVTGVATDPDVDKIFVANAFTPNGDGKNDVVYVHNDNVKSLKFYVYDQWGNMLFQSLSQPKGWDGTYKGKTEPAGVYVYYLEAIMNDGKTITKKGTITLLR